MEIILIVLLLAILGVSVASLVKRDKHCTDKVKVGSVQNNIILPPDVSTKLLKSVWTDGSHNTQIAPNAYSIGPQSYFEVLSSSGNNTWNLRGSASKNNWPVLLVSLTLSGDKFSLIGRDMENSGWGTPYVFMSTQ